MFTEERQKGHIYLLIHMLCKVDL